jgi:hypothetical protein
MIKGKRGQGVDEEGAVCNKHWLKVQRGKVGV